MIKYKMKLNRESELSPINLTRDEYLKLDKELRKFYPICTTTNKEEKEGLYIKKYQKENDKYARITLIKEGWE